MTQRGNMRHGGAGDVVVGLSETCASMRDLVGGKAANLGEMITAGERVPLGFCVTTAAYSAAQLPVEEIAAAYAGLGGGPVAVRSSATEEDLAEASFAGQQDTYLNIEGVDAVIDAVSRCWESLDNERATAYRQANAIDHGEVRMAIVVQRMVEADTAGVLFTADPLAGSRSRSVVDAVRGLGTAVVDGSTEPDHYVLDDGKMPRFSTGCLADEQLKELAAAGRRLQGLFGAPQDIEWAFDSDGVLWLLQSRAITTLFPAPPQDVPDGPQLYLEMGHMQGMLRPFTPMGMTMVQQIWARWCATVGVTIDPYAPDGLMVDIGGRLYVNISSMLRSKWMRRSAVDSFAVYGPRVQRMVKHMLNDPRFAAREGLPLTVRTAVTVSLALLPRIVDVGWSLARPEAARGKAYVAVERMRRSTGPGEDATARQRWGWLVGSGFDVTLGKGMNDVIGPVVAGIVAGTAPAVLLKGIATQRETDAALGGMPYNVTTEMDLALWQLAVEAREHGTLFSDTPPDELARCYRRGELPEIGIEEFLASYGHRAAAEIDIGVPRWRDDPTPVFDSIANYLRLLDPEHAPDRRFQRAADAAETTIASLSERGVRARPVRGRLARFFLRRSRALTGMREFAKFAWLVPFAELRRQLMLVGRDLVDAGVLNKADDIMFLEFNEAYAATRQYTDFRALVTERRRTHERELLRKRVPPMLLTDGTDVAATMPPDEAPENGFVGVPAAAGNAQGSARVILDPVGAHIEPGEILVAPTTDPGWTPLFLPAAGLVSDTGSTIAHGPTVAREYGIPAVICVPEATTSIRTGDLLRIDGATGTVELVQQTNETQQRTS